MYINNNSFEAYMERLAERLEIIETKIDRLLSRRNEIGGEKLLDNQDLCFLLRVSPRTLVRYRNSGLLPFKTINRRNFYLESDVHMFIREHFDKGKIRYNKTRESDNL